MPTPTLKNRAPGGFTLIEILVVVSIISIVSALVITTLSSNKAVTAAEQSAQAFLAHIRHAQNSALTGQNRNSTEENCYIAVRIESATRYRVVNYYRSGGSCGSIYNTMATYDLTNGARFSGMSYPTTLAFLLPRAEVYRSTGGALAAMGSTQLVSFTRSGHTRSVCLYPTGRIEAVGPAVSCP